MAEAIVKQAFDLEKVSSQSENDLFYFVESDSVSSEKITALRYSYWKSVFRIFFKKKINWFLLGLFAFILLMSIFFPLIFPYDEMENVINTDSYFLSPAVAMSKYGVSLKWLLGTGPVGNSIFYGVWASAATSIALSFVCATINMALGIVIGAVWGYNKTLDSILNVVYNIIADVPYILIVSVMVYIIGSGFFPFVIALTITGWLGIAYFFRTQVLIIRDREYNLASRCLGTPILTVVKHNILPFLTSVIMTILATELPGYISYEVFLSYIGIGLSAETPSLGQMIERAQTGFISYPWAFWAPVTVASAITVILYVLGQNLADASDPRTHM
ncbi:MAG: ABC transporter permease [Bacilli bacterium]|nr:ABC transporter permease [Bacilli bacterium]